MELRDRIGGFISSLNTVQKIKTLKNGQLYKLNIEVNSKKLKRNNRKSIF